MITTNFSAGVWLAERSLIYCTGATPGATVNVKLQWRPVGVQTYTTLLEVEYITDASGAVTIDVSDALRAYRYTTGVLRVYVENVTDSETHSQGVTVQGLINPARMLVPAHDADDVAYIVPPRKMLCTYMHADQIVFEFRPNESAYAGAWELTEKQADGSILEVETITPPIAEAENEDAAIFEITGTDGGANYMIRRELVETTCAKTYALVEWLSSTGATRRHYFEVVGQTLETSEVVALENIENEYDETKGRTDGFSLRIENLERYDVWYYADVVTSSRVRVSFDNGDTWRQVQITTKSAEIANSDEGAQNNLEIALKYCKYDAIRN